MLFIYIFFFSIYVLRICFTGIRSFLSIATFHTIFFHYSHHTAGVTRHLWDRFLPHVSLATRHISYSLRANPSPCCVFLFFSKFVYSFLFLIFIFFRFILFYLHTFTFIFSSLTLSLFHICFLFFHPSFTLLQPYWLSSRLLILPLAHLPI